MTLKTLSTNGWLKDGVDNFADLGAGPGGASFTIGTEAANVINVAIQLTDWFGDDLAVAGHVMAYLSDDADGVGISGTAPATSVAIGTDGAIIKELTTKLAWMLQSSPPVIPLIGGSSVQQIELNLGALSTNLTKKQLELLNQDIVPPEKY